MNIEYKGEINYSWIQKTLLKNSMSINVTLSESLLKNFFNMFVGLFSLKINIITLDLPVF